MEMIDLGMLSSIVRESRETAKKISYFFYVIMIVTVCNQNMYKNCMLVNITSL
jgi:hypothetical protein